MAIFSSCIYRVARKVIPCRIMNELALKPANNAIFRVKFVCIEEAQKYYMMVLNILCMTYFVPSSFTELQTAI